jgi:hypothetical protein
VRAFRQCCNDVSTLATPFLCHVSFCVHGGSTRVTRSGFAACRKRALHQADASPLKHALMHLGTSTALAMAIESAQL